MTDFPSPSAPDLLLTPEEARLVDAALLTSPEKFTTRVAIYALRSLQQIAQEQAVDIADLTDAAILAWIDQRSHLDKDPLTTPAFQQFYTQLVMAALKPLRQIAQTTKQPLSSLTVPQIIYWFEQESRQKLEH